MPRRRLAAVGAVSVAVVAVVAVAAAYWAALGLTGVDAATLGGWSLSVVFRWLVPGFVVVRVVRASSLSLLDQFAWSLPTGLVVVLLAWVADRALTVPGTTELAGITLTATLVVVGVAVPFTRRRLLRRTESRWRTPATLVVAGSLIVVAGWAAAAGLAALPVAPGAAGFAYAPDAMFHLAMTGELGRSLRPTYPMVAGEPISYHWFYYAAAAQLGSGLDTMTVALRLFPLALLLATVVMVATLARQLAGDRLGPAAGALGALLAGVVGNTQATAWILPTGIVGRYDGNGGGLDPLGIYWQHSPTTTFGWVATLAAAGILLAVLRGTRCWGYPAVYVAVLFTAGAKASAPPVLLGGLLLVIAVAAIRRRRATVLRGLLCLGMLAAAYATAVLIIYGAGSYGLRPAPGFRAAWLAARYATGEDAGRWAAAIAVGLAVSLLPTVPRLLGLGWLVARRADDPGGVLMLGAVIAGYLGTNLTGHPGHSEVFFVVSAYPLGLAGAAAGLVLIGAHLFDDRGRRRVLLGLGIAAGVAVLGASALLVFLGDRPPAPGSPLSSWTAPMLTLAGVLAVAVVAAAPCWWRSARQAAMTAVVALLAAGLVPTGLAVVSVRDADVRRETRIVDAETRGLALSTPALLEAAAIIRTRAGPDDVVAANRVCVLTRQRPGSGECDARDFTVAAFSGHRTDVTGWAYADRVVSSAWFDAGRYASRRFWDPPRLAAEQGLISAPSIELTRQAWARGVRWVLADAAVGPVSARLPDYGTLEFDQAGIIVVRLREPA